MNDVLQEVMTFINENTYFLIGICIFLILVLIGYLIDNSVKSKRVRKDIKNKDQVPESIKNEIIKEAMNENKEKIMENSFNNAVREENKVLDDNITNNENGEGIVENVQNQNFDKDDLMTSLSLDSSNNSTFSLDNEVTQNNNSQDSLSQPLILDNTNDDNVFDFNITEAEQVDDLSIDTPMNIDINIDKDPDIDIMDKKSNYTNDKKLSEILLDIDRKSTTSIKKESNEIFEKPIQNIEINRKVDKDKLEIEKVDNSSDELDKIMKKLSSMNNGEDNYTNIF